jgi:hypothetical protein
MNENIIAWNVTNWITVILMAAIGFFIVGTVLKWKSNRSKPVSVDTSTAGAASLA